MGEFVNGWPARKLNLRQRFERHIFPEPNSGCHLWDAGVNEKGYGTIRWQGQNRLSHRIAWQLFKGPIPRGLCVCHKCDVPSCVNPDHLWLGTSAQNTADMIAKGRMALGDKRRFQWGEHNASSKLTDAQAADIRTDGRVQEVIAEEYGVSQSLISMIKRGAVRGPRT